MSANKFFWIFLVDQSKSVLFLNRNVECADKQTALMNKSIEIEVLKENSLAGESAIR